MSRRTVTLMIRTKQGTCTVKAWTVGSLAVHRSWKASGWTVTHRPSGKAIASRLRSKPVALALAQRLLTLPSCDWTSRDLIPAMARPAVLHLVNAAPRWVFRQRAHDQTKEA
jgi:hypothetical protein